MMAEEVASFQLLEPQPRGGRAWCTTKSLSRPFVISTSTGIILHTTTRPIHSYSPTTTSFFPFLLSLQLQSRLCIVQLIYATLHSCLSVLYQCLISQAPVIQLPSRVEQRESRKRDSWRDSPQTSHSHLPSISPTIAQRKSKSLVLKRIIYNNSPTSTSLIAKRGVESTASGA